MRCSQAAWVNHTREVKVCILETNEVGATRWQNSLSFNNTLSTIQFGMFVRAKCRVCKQKIKCCAITRNHLQLLCDCFLFSTCCVDRSLSSSLHRGVKCPLSDIDTFKVNRPRAAANVPLCNLIAGTSTADFAKKNKKLQHVLILFGVFCQLWAPRLYEADKECEPNVLFSSAFFFFFLLFLRVLTLE